MVRHKSACKPHRKEETHNLSEVRLQLGYRNNCFFFDTNPSIFNRCATMPMIIFRTWATCDPYHLFEKAGHYNLMHGG